MGYISYYKFIRVWKQKLLKITRRPPKGHLVRRTQTRLMSQLKRIQTSTFFLANGISRSTRPSSSMLSETLCPPASLPLRTWSETSMPPSRRSELERSLLQDLEETARRQSSSSPCRGVRTSLRT